MNDTRPFLIASLLATILCLVIIISSTTNPTESQRILAAIVLSCTITMMVASLFIAVKMTRKADHRKAPGLQREIDDPSWLDHSLIFWHPPDPKPDPDKPVLIKLPISGTPFWEVGEANWIEADDGMWVFGVDVLCPTGDGYDVLGWAYVPRGELPEGHKAINGA